MEPDHGITGEQDQRLGGARPGRPGLAGPGGGLGAAAGIEAERGLAHVVGSPGDQAPDGGDTGEGPALLRTPGLQQDVQLGLPEVGVRGPEPADLLAQGGRPPGLPPPVRSPGAGGQGVRLASGLGERPLPPVEGAAAHPKRLPRRDQAVPSPKLQNSESVLSLVGYHVPTRPELS